MAHVLVVGGGIAGLWTAVKAADAVADPARLALERMLAAKPPVAAAPPGSAKAA